MGIDAMHSQHFICSSGPHAICWSEHFIRSHRATEQESEYIGHSVWKLICHYFYCSTSVSVRSCRMYTIMVFAEFLSVFRHIEVQYSNDENGDMNVRKYQMKESEHSMPAQPESIKTNGIHTYKAIALTSHYCRCPKSACWREHFFASGFWVCHFLLLFLWSVGRGTANKID